MEIYTFQIERIGAEAGSQLDISGFAVEATDGEIGEVDEATYAEASSYLVVDTGFWIFGKKRLIPAAVVTRIDPDEKRVYVNMTKDAIKAAPDHDAARLDAGASAFRREVGDYYAPYAR